MYVIYDRRDFNAGESAYLRDAIRNRDAVNVLQLRDGFFVTCFSHSISIRRLFKLDKSSRFAVEFIYWP